MGTELLGSAEVARRLSVSALTLGRWRAEGKGPRAVKIGRTWRYPVDGLEEYIRSCVTASEQFDESSQQLRDAGVAD